MSRRADELLTSAAAAGEISQETARSIIIDDLGAQIQAGLGVSVDDVQAAETTLVAALLDNSGSMGPMEAEARTGFNRVLDALAGSKQDEGILMMVSDYSGVIAPFSLVSGVDRLQPQSYRPGGMTPLMDASLALFATVLAKAQEFEDQGVACRTVSYVVTDGGDNASRHRPAAVAKLVRDMLKSEKHIIAGIGIDDGVTDFRQVFLSMGIRDEWILTPGNTESEVRRVFDLISKSAVQASKGAASFSKTALGGFDS